MNQEYVELIWYAIPISAIFAFYVIKNRNKQHENIKMLNESIAAGLTEPVSLHPKIDYNKCIGSGACVTACPEGDVIGIINGKAQLINPTKCIGHGACKAACPLEAITLVFGTEKRGVDIPNIDEDFQTNVPGLYIAGELGGMGLIRNAVTQGKQAIDAIFQKRSSKNNEQLDVVIVGAGPAGFSASLAALEKKLNFVTLEQDSLGGTVAHFPRGKIVMTAPVILPLIGKLNFTEVSKEDLIDTWQAIMKKTGLKIKEQEQMTDIVKTENGFIVKTQRSEYKTKNILLAIGRRGTPRKLDVKGEDKNKVVYKLVDAEQYQGKHVLIVGGGDSALEAALSIAEVDDTTVSISYRNNTFSRAKQKNRDRIAAAVENGSVNVIWPSDVKEILDDKVVITVNDKETTLINDIVIVCAGGVLPTPFLNKIGIQIETKHGTE